jgi:hypothetical protein
MVIVRHGLIAAPGQPGEQELRYFVEDGYIDAARSASITVNAVPIAASLDADVSLGRLERTAHKENLRTSWSRVTI